MISLILTNCSKNLSLDEDQDRYLTTFDVVYLEPGNNKNFQTILVDRINNAEDFVQCAFWRFDQDQVANAIINAYNKGIDVKFVSDENTASDPSTVKLINAGVPSVFGNGLTRADYESSMTYNFCIIDELYVWSTTGGVTDQALTNQYNIGFDIYSETLAEDYMDEFNQLYGGVFGDKWAPFQSAPLKSSDTYYSFELNQLSLNIYYGPQESPVAELIKEVYRARKSVRFLTPMSDDQGIFTALEYKNNYLDQNGNNSFILEGVINEANVSKSTQPDKDLSQLNVKKFSTNQIGATFFLLDHELDRKTICIYTNSIMEGFNESSSPEAQYIDYNDSSLIIIKNKHPDGTDRTNNLIFKAMLDLFNSIWNSPDTSTI